MIFSRNSESSIDLVQRGDFKRSPSPSISASRLNGGSGYKKSSVPPTPEENQEAFRDSSQEPFHTQIVGGCTNTPQNSSTLSLSDTSIVSKTRKNSSNSEAFPDSKTSSDTESLPEKGKPQPQGITARDLDWDGPDDKANPQNWSSFKKWFITFVVALDCLCVSLGSSIYVESVPDIMTEMGVSQRLGISGLTLYLVGLALGPIIAAPMSELFGRRWIYIISLPIGMLFTMGVGLAKDIRTVLVLRFFSGFFNSPPMSVAGGTVSDLWSNDPSQLAVAMALFCLAPFLGPVFGPIIGGFAVKQHSWEWSQWVLLIFSGAIMPLLFLCPETLKHVVLKKRATERGIKLEKLKWSFGLVKMVATIFLFRPVEMIVVEPIVCLTSIYVAFVFAVLFGFFQAYPVIFRGIYGMESGVSGLPFLGVGVGLIIGVLGFIMFDLHIFHPKNEDGTRGKFDENGEPDEGTPESRLIVAAIGSLFLPVSLFWLAWTSRESIHWIAPTLAGVPFGFGLIWVFFGIVLYYSMTYPAKCLASALATNNVLRYSLASVFPLFVFDMYEELKVDWATSVFAFVSLAMVPLPFVFYKFGSKFRQNSKYSFEAEARMLEAEEEKNQKISEKMTDEPRSFNSEGIDSPFVRSSRTVTEAQDMIAEKV